MALIPEKLRLAVSRTRAAGSAPDWVVLDLHGSYPTHAPAGAAAALLQRDDTFEALTERLDRLAKADWLTGVLVRVGELKVGLSTARALGAALGRLAARKHVVGYVPQVSMRTLLVTARASEVVVPESAEVSLPGFAAEQVFLGAFLAKHGITFENLRIREYKSALTAFSEDRMDEYEREQLTAYLDSAERTWLDAVADGADPASVLGAGFTNAEELLAAGLVSRIAYDDEIVTVVDQHWPRALELLLPDLSARKLARKADGVAIVPVVGAIVSGRSRSTPPLPIGPGPTAGSETVVTALRRAERDEHVKAVVLWVDSPGGSALASDVIGRAVARCAKPVVAVMGQVAASGGYYVLTHADHVVADPYTITGSIGVVVGKPVLAQLDERQGLNPQTVGREAALFASPHRPFTAEQRAWAEKMMEEVYARFVDRVAAGRSLSHERVDEIGRGRIWSGQDAAGIGLVDELGDLHDGIAAARRLAGLGEHAPVRTVSAGLTLPGLPSFATQPAGAVERLWPFGSEKVLTWFDRSVRIR
ncbi:signal peptide peptidase SppA [Oceanitalea stevensii]|uniref:Signal peptide peptidase SppA n=1 Tax=Oceanitalea stevensii TaxID=2763072 RepID=A0ABR8Z358_9MICO|nr:signal peptide peptidase SppA [Oceanitalea stevensii]MBD8062234.1 signal peptide peptidase SppA [Oceanitalea stevensii]